MTGKASLLKSLARRSKWKGIFLAGFVLKAGGDAYRWGDHCYYIWQNMLSQTDLYCCYACMSRCVKALLGIQVLCLPQQKQKKHPFHPFL